MRFEIHRVTHNIIVPGMVNFDGAISYDKWGIYRREDDDSLHFCANFETEKTARRVYELMREAALAALDAEGIDQ